MHGELQGRTPCSEWFEHRTPQSLVHQILLYKEVISSHLCSRMLIQFSCLVLCLAANCTVRRKETAVSESPSCPLIKTVRTTGACRQCYNDSCTSAFAGRSGANTGGAERKPQLFEGFDQPESGAPVRPAHHLYRSDTGEHILLLVRCGVTQVISLPAGAVRCDNHCVCVQLTSKSPETFLDLTEDGSSLSALGFKNGQMVWCSHQQDAACLLSPLFTHRW